MSVLALIPARLGSRGILKKNFRALAGRSPVERAWQCAEAVTPWVGITTDATTTEIAPLGTLASEAILWVVRPAALAQDDTPMIEVVRHALAQIPGPADQMILLVEPTQPLREPKHLHAALAALTADWDSVVTLTPIPRTHAPGSVLMCDSTLTVSPWQGSWVARPTRRQAPPQPYIADGTAYVFRRHTVQAYGNIYGEYVRGLLIPPEETCPLDDPCDWAEADRRLREREHG